MIENGGWPRRRRGGGWPQSRGAGLRPGGERMDQGAGEAKTQGGSRLSLFLRLRRETTLTIRGAAHGLLGSWKSLNNKVCLGARAERRTGADEKCKVMG